MVTSDQLLQLIARLQHSESAAQGRNLLLKYMRKQSQAQLVTLFMLDKEQQVLVPLAHNGKLPEAPTPTEEGTSDQQAHRQPARKSIPVDGLFGSALLTQDALQIANVGADARLLPDERAWVYPEGSVLIQAIKAGPQNAQGVLLLSFRTVQQDMQKNLTGDLRICSILLSTYVVDDAKKRPQDVPIASVRPRRAGARSNTLELLQTPPIQHSTLPEVMYSLTMLSDLYEIGLVLDTAIDNQDLYQSILAHISQTIQARFSCLLLYHPSLRRLIPAARAGDELACDALVNAIDGIEIERLASSGPGQFLSFLRLGLQHVLLVTLSYNGVLFGVVALAISEDNKLSDERSLLLTYMGNIAALLLRNYSTHAREQQAAIEQERNRIARDIHDGSTQQIAHVLHKLEFVQHLLTRQPLLPHVTQTALGEVERARDLLAVSLNDLRRSISSLLPAQLEEQDFVVALHCLLDDYMLSDPDLTITLNMDTPDDLPVALEASIYRFIQEALTNVSKHAQATHATISIRVLANALVVEVQDNGVGFQPELVARVAVKSPLDNGSLHLGLRTMRERIQDAGGSLEIESDSGRGTCVRARFTLVSSVQLLTDREHEVLRLIVAGQTNRDIAEKLSIGLETVKSHVHHIMQKMQVKDRTQAAVLATRHGWL
jgi:signal transduction histidine kinase/DNA-binding CsgD family transcriptional regulator